MDLESFYEDLQDDPEYSNDGRGGMESDDFDDYDIQNDETFGADFMASDNDMENFANKAAELALQDHNELKSKNKNIPTTSFNNILKSKTSENELNDSIWGGNSFNGIKSMIETYPIHKQHEKEFNNSQRQLSFTDQQMNIKTLEELEGRINTNSNLNEKLSSSYHRFDNKAISLEELEKNLILQSLPTTSAISADDLERRLLNECVLGVLPAVEASVSTPIVMQNSDINNLMAIKSASRLPFYSRPHDVNSPLLPMSVNGLPPINAAHCVPPPPCPFLPILNSSNASIHHSAVSPNHIPPIPLRYQLQPGSIPPYQGSIQKQSQLDVSTTMAPLVSPMRYEIANFPPSISSTISNASTFTPLNMPPPCLHLDFIKGQNKPIFANLSMIPSALVYNPLLLATKKRRSKQASLSNKTISDYALDPAAGLMSKKEQEWLVKIHLIQCTLTGDQIEDDYYYAMWKKRNGLNNPPPEWKMKGKGKYYSFENTYPSSSYVAPSFSGSLGRPLHCTASNPRQMIDASCESMDDDELNSTNRQRKIRKLLMKIENSEIILIECNDIKRKLDFFEDTQITNLIDKHEITNRTAKLAENLSLLFALFSADTLSQIMHVQKGRSLVYRVLAVMIDTKFAYFVALDFFQNLPKFAKKIPDSEVLNFIEVMQCLLQAMRNDEIVKIAQSLCYEEDLIKTCGIVQSVQLLLLVNTPNFVSDYGQAQCVKWLNLRSTLCKIVNCEVPLELWKRLLSNFSNIQFVPGSIAEQLINEIKIMNNFDL